MMKSEKEWRDSLSKEVFDITRKGDTEPPFTGEYWNCSDAGTYLCVCCSKPLFSSKTKYDSGTGWPSFYEPTESSAVKEKEDNSLFMRRTEVCCAECDAHLGHVFPDGPKPTGLRYCINSASLSLQKD